MDRFDDRPESFVWFFFVFFTRYFNRTKCKVTCEKHLETGFDVGAMVKLFRDMFQLVSFYGYFEFSRTDD